jgi:hypothetical protein
MTRLAGLLTLTIGATALAGGASFAEAEPTCVAIALPSVQGAEGSAISVGNTFRDLITGYLSGPSIQAVQLDARLPALAVEEARQKPCGYILVTTLHRTRGGGGPIGEAAGVAAWHIPVGSSAAAAVARGAAAGGAQAAATTAAYTRAKDEWRLEYRLASPNDIARIAAKVEKAKARVDGEDLLTPLAERVATAMVTTLAAK